jgi:hypothetical protein
MPYLGKDYQPLGVKAAASQRSKFEDRNKLRVT